MNVNMNVHQNYLKAQEYGAYNKDAEPSTAVKPSGAKLDKVCISADAAAYTARDKEVKSMAAQVHALGSSDRISSLRDQIKSGSYQVSPANVADAMLERFAI